MSKSIYHQLCKSQPLPIFMQDWWLDALCGNDWQPLIAFDKENKPQAAMTIHFRKKMGLSFILPPPLTPISGAWFAYPELSQKRHSRYQLEMKLTEDLIKQLPVSHLFLAQLGHHFDNWLPFLWRGFKQKVRYTFLIENLDDFLQVEKNFNENVKRNLKKAKDLTVLESDDVAKLYELAQSSLQRNDSSLNFSLEKLIFLHQKIKENQSGQIFQVKNNENDILASVLVVWDNEKAYYLVAGDNRQNPAANTFLIQQILKKMSEKGVKTFDFEGSMIEPIANFYRSFGAKPLPYHFIYKAKNKFWYLIFKLLNFF